MARGVGGARIHNSAAGGRHAVKSVLRAQNQGK